MLAIVYFSTIILTIQNQKDYAPYEETGIVGVSFKCHRLRNTELKENCIITLR